MRKAVPVLICVAVSVLLLYPLALIFGFPQARRDMEDSRKWLREATVSQPAPVIPPAGSTTGTAVTAAFGADAAGVPVFAGRRLSSGQREDWVDWSGTLEAVPDAAVLSYGTELPEQFELYADGGDGFRHLERGSSPPALPPDGKRDRFTFGTADGPVLLDGEVLEEEDDYVIEGGAVRFLEPPAFGSELRRLLGDYDILDAEAGLLALSSSPEPDREFRLAASVLGLAPHLLGDTDGNNREFRFPEGGIIEADSSREVWLDDELLSDSGERPEERVDGEAATFTFAGSAGLVVMDGKLQEEGADYTRAGPEVTFSAVPPRNARLRQYPDYWLDDPEAGSILLAAAPAADQELWTSRYVRYSRPACGETVTECFLALPQHPVPFPHWIAERIQPFFGRYAITDERNALRATLYTTLGTTSALLLGGALGIFLAVLFVLFRPLERTLLPWAIASQTVPIIALVPVLLLVLGNFGITIQTSLLPTALVGAYLCFFPIVVSTTKGLRAVEPIVLDLMRSYAASRLEVFWRVRLPAATPFLFTGLKLGMAAALVGALVAETESNNRRGLGYQILGQVQSGSVADVWILLIVSAVLGIVLVGLIGLLQRLVAPWERRA
ncbi:MAG TPA: ABC transporter permease subunit [Deinococcales bacterium]|nr:ABC transporter permease subunit [Deinococcales bacterium]